MTSDGRIEGRELASTQDQPDFCGRVFWSFGQHLAGMVLGEERHSPKTGGIHRSGMEPRLPLSASRVGRALGTGFYDAGLEKRILDRGLQPRNSSQLYPHSVPAFLCISGSAGKRHARDVPGHAHPCFCVSLQCGMGILHGALALFRQERFLTSSCSVPALPTSDC